MNTRKNITILFTIVVALYAKNGPADEAPLSGTMTPAQAQARQLGILFGGTASQYDLCVKKGFLPKGSRSAEETATSVLDKARSSSNGSDPVYVQDGWDMMKKEIADHESFYTKEKCASVGKEWSKIMASVK